MTLDSIPLATMDLQIADGVRRNWTQICAPVMAETVDQMLTQARKAKELGADLVEIRLDFLKTFNPRQDLEILIKQCPLPTLITYRPIWEGGKYDGDESKRQNALCLAMELGADYIDVELKVAHDFYNAIQGKKPAKIKIIVSSHNYQNTPSLEEIGNLVARIQATGADIVKVATTAVDITDSARIFQILVHSQVPILIAGAQHAFLMAFQHMQEPMYMQDKPFASQCLPLGHLIIGFTYCDYLKKLLAEGVHEDFLINGGINELLLELQSEA